MRTTRSPLPIRTGLDGLFLLAVAILAIAYYPCSLLYPNVNFDQRWIRLVISIPLAALGAAGLTFFVRRKKTELILWSALALTVAVLVLAMPPACHGKGFAISLPALLFLLPLSFAAISTANVNYPRLLIGAAVVFTLLAIVKAFTAIRDLDLILPFLGFVWLPIAVAAMFREKRLTQSWMETTACIVYLFSVGYASLQVFTGAHDSPPGTSGNPNWLSCTLVGVTPWVGAVAVRFFRKTSLGPRLSLALGWAVTLVPAAFILWKCQTRALFLVIAIGIVGWVFIILKRKLLKIIWCLLCLGLVGYAGQRRASQIHSAIAQDVRLPLWISCIRLASEHPVLGVSPRDVQRDLPDILAESRYHTRFVASEWMAHPHNELINVALNLGFPAAIAWLLILIPLFKVPDSNEGYGRTAWVSATLMVLLGMADKGLAEGPAVVIFPVCLGILWASRLTVVDEEPSKPRRVTNLIALSTALATLVLAAYLGSSQLVAQWWNRRGDQLLAAGYNRAAKRLYEKGLAAVSADVDTAYTIAAVSLQRITPFDPIQSGKDLKKVYEMNPNFGHVNRLMGRYWLQCGELDKAREFFMRDMELFPENALSGHWLVYSLLREDKPKRLQDAERELLRRIHNRIESYCDFTHQESLLVMWLAAMDNAQEDPKGWQVAIDRCKLLLSRLRAHDYVAPLCPWSSGQSWPEAFLGLTSSANDVPYWKSVMFRETYYDERFPNASFNKIREDVATEDGEQNDIWTICRAVYDRVDFSDASQWSFPHDTWESNTGSWDGGYSLLAWLYPGTMLMVVPAAQESTETEALVFPPQSSTAGKAGLVARVNLPKRTIEFMDEKTTRVFVATHASQLRMVALPHEYLTRTHAYHAVARKTAGYRENLCFGGLPSVRYALLRNHFPELPKVVSPWSVPGQAILESFSNRR